MRLHKTLSWCDPLDLARGIPGGEAQWVLLYSALQQGDSGTRSILALCPRQQIIAEDFDAFAKVLHKGKTPWEHAWFGYLGYGLKNALEQLPEDQPDRMGLPHLWMIRFRLILVFDHTQKTIEVWADSKADLQHIPLPIKATPVPELAVKALASNMSKSQYLANVRAIKEAIVRGDVYQANMTRKFFGEIRDTANPVEVFAKLCQVSPAPYSALLKLNEHYIVSSSPERFLHIGADGMVDTRPIKGSAKRLADCTQDDAARLALQNSAKDRAENLMIVDLSRNDLSRGCEPGSVKVEHLFEVISYATVHHMVSTITGKKRNDVSVLDLVKGCFPPGSMTGTPKIQAMRLCTELEKDARGVYSGAIGWFGGDASVDLSVVIRTLIMQGNRFEFQVGGAIVADSTPDSEWQETLTKAIGMARVLGISQEELEGI